MATPASSQFWKTLAQEFWIISFSFSVRGLGCSMWSSSPSLCILSICEHSWEGLSTRTGRVWPTTLIINKPPSLPLMSSPSLWQRKKIISLSSFVRSLSLLSTSKSRMNECEWRTDLKKSPPPTLTHKNHAVSGEEPRYSAFYILPFPPPSSFLPYPPHLCTIGVHWWKAIKQILHKRTQLQWAQSEIMLNKIR